MPRDPSQLDVTGRPVALRSIDLDVFFRPRTVAVIGASDTPARPNTGMPRKVRAWSEAAGAAFHPVSPNRTEVEGLPCVPRLADAPGHMHLAVILTGDAVRALE